MTDRTRALALSALAGAIVVAIGLTGYAATRSGETDEVVKRAGRPSGILRDPLPEARAIYRQAAPSVVFVRARGRAFGSDEATGTGFVFRRGLVLTSEHIVAGFRDVDIESTGDGDLEQARVLATDPSTDLAVLSIPAPSAPPLDLGDSDAVRAGDPIAVISDPFGYDRTITAGIVSAVGRQVVAPDGFTIDGAIQTDAAINPGSSGAPLLDRRGRVVGVAIEGARGETVGSNGIAFAVPSETAARVARILARGQSPVRGYLGASSIPLTPALARVIGLSATRGVLVQTVAPRSPAARAGLRGGRIRTDDGQLLGGDVIVAAGGRRVDSPADLAEAVARRRPGTLVALTVDRARRRQTVVVRVGVRGAAPTMPAP